jgi:hypothetical protein
MHFAFKYMQNVEYLRENVILFITLQTAYI